MRELIPIFALIAISAACIAVAVVLAIRSKKSRIRVEEKDFIDVAIERKKGKLKAIPNGLTWKTYTGLMLIFSLGAAVISFIFLRTKVFCVLFAFLGLFIPEVISQIQARSKDQKFEEKYAQALRALSSSLRSGLTLEQSLEELCRNPFIDENVRSGFRDIYSDVKVGIRLDAAFKRFAVAYDSDDAWDVASAISMQLEVGGSEAMVVNTIAQNIGDRIMARKEIKTLFSETNVMITTMDFIPFILFLIFYFGAPQMITPFFESLGMMLILVGVLAFTTIGSILIHKMAKNAKEGK